MIPDIVQGFKTASRIHPGLLERAYIFGVDAAYSWKPIKSAAHDVVFMNWAKAQGVRLLPLVKAYNRGINSIRPQ
jgi:hypothetical protein